jgi:hypothetical protein
MLNRFSLTDKEGREENFPFSPQTALKVTIHALRKILTLPSVL